MLLAAQILSYYTASNSYASLVLSKLPVCIHNTWEVIRLESTQEVLLECSPNFPSMITMSGVILKQIKQKCVQ